MGAKYTDLSPTGYNASPPSDDGSLTDANKVKWVTHIDKIGGPLNDWIQAINDALVTYVTVGPVVKSSAFTTTADENDKTIEVTGTTPISLGDATTMTAGYTVSIYNADASLTTTVDLATGGDTLDGTAGGSITLTPGEGSLFRVNAAADGYITLSNAGARLGVANVFTKTQTWNKGADIASATTLVLGTDGNYFDVTGTTAITAITAVTGTFFMLHFDGALTLTHHATNLILPGEANITTAAGDEAMFFAYASGDVRCISYSKADGSSIAGGMRLLATNTLSTSTTSEFNNTYVNSTYDHYIIELADVRPATDGVNLQMRVSNDNGVSFEQGATDYEYNVVTLSSGTAGVAASSNSQGDTSITIAGGFGNVAAEAVSGQIHLWSPSNAATFTKIYADLTFWNSSATSVLVRAISIGSYNTAAEAHDAIQLYLSSGNLTSGTMKLYGVKK